MEFTKTFLRAKSPCADGFRWFVRNVEDGSGYQEALDTLVSAGRVDDACWLLTQFGPTNAVLSVDSLNAEAVVFAGTLEVRGGIDVDTVVQAGRSIRAGGGIRAGRAIVAGEDIRVAGSIHSQGMLQAGGDVRADWGIEVQNAILCGGNVRAAWDLICHGKLSLTGSAFVGQDLIIHLSAARACALVARLSALKASGPGKASWPVGPSAAECIWKLVGASGPANPSAPMAPSRPARACRRAMKSAQALAMGFMPV